jgi:hypothetical protein
VKLEGGVGVAGSDVGLLYHQTTMRDSVASEEGEGLFTVNRAGVKNRGPCCQVDPGHVLKVLGSR